MFIHFFIYLVGGGYVYVPKCTHTIVHMWPEGNVQDTIPVFRVGLQVVVFYMSYPPSQLTGPHVLQSKETR